MTHQAASMKLNEYVVVTWRDSGSIDGLVWQFKDDWSCDVHQCDTMGILVENSDDKVVLAQSSNPDQWGRLFAIPKESVTSIKVLELTPKPPKAVEKGKP